DVDRAIAVTVDSFVGAQKVSCKKALARAFAKYVFPLLLSNFPFPLPFSLLLSPSRRTDCIWMFENGNVMELELQAKKETKANECPYNRYTLAKPNSRSQGQGRTVRVRRGAAGGGGRMQQTAVMT
ncbi:MAG: hypothetical protein Q9228_008122, partial [Teloschistes exilis]